MPTPTIVIETSATAPRVLASIADGLSAANLSAYPSATQTSLVWGAYLDHELIGGLSARLACDWLRVDKLWVASAHRRLGVGTRLLRTAETFAADALCVGSHLDTFCFQCPDFYLRHGYESFDTLENSPRGHRHFFMVKRFSPESTAAPLGTRAA
jgi:GNAT superfamily N-acetyltransferase